MTDAAARQKLAALDRRWRDVGALAVVDILRDGDAWKRAAAAPLVAAQTLAGRQPPVAFTVLEGGRSITQPSQRICPGSAG
jgi:hypothetical protein